MYKSARSGAATLFFMFLKFSVDNVFEGKGYINLS